MKKNTVKPKPRVSNARRPHIVGAVVMLQGADGKPFKYLWRADRSRYPGAKVRELAKRLPRRVRAAQLRTAQYQQAAE